MSAKKQRLPEAIRVLMVAFLDSGGIRFIQPGLSPKDIDLGKGTS